jgi:hypothetical protein
MATGTTSKTKSPITDTGMVTGIRYTFKTLKF